MISRKMTRETYNELYRTHRLMVQGFEPEPGKRFDLFTQTDDLLKHFTSARFAKWEGLENFPKTVVTKRYMATINPDTAHELADAYREFDIAPVYK